MLRPLENEVSFFFSCRESFTYLCRCAVEEYGSTSRWRSTQLSLRAVNVWTCPSALSKRSASFSLVNELQGVIGELRSIKRVKYNFYFSFLLLPYPPTPSTS